MTSERTILIEPVAPVVYLNKRPYCNWFPLVVMLLFLIAACGFLVQVKAISQLKTEVAELKSEVAALKEEDLHLWDEAWRNAMAKEALTDPSKYSYAQMRQLWRARDAEAPANHSRLRVVAIAAWLCRTSPPPQARLLAAVRSDAVR